MAPILHRDDDRNRWRPAIFAAAIALALYAVTLGGTYVYDDRYIVLADPRLIDLSRWGEFWTKDYFLGGADNLYRPLVSMSYAIQAKLHGNADSRAWLFHAVNWLLHACVSALVAELARRITRSTTVATIAGVLFAVHPIHVEAVANIVGRAELMCALGVIGALVLFMRPLTNWRVVAIWACMVVAILSKEQGLLLPLMLVGAIPLRREPDVAGSGSSGRKMSPPTILLILLTIWTLAGYLVIRERILKFSWDRSFLDPTINPIIRSEGMDRLLMPFELLGRYVALLVAPLRLNPDYGGDTIGSTVSLADPYLYLGVIAVAASIVACVFALTRPPRKWLIVFCVLSFALVFGMISNLLTLIGTNFGERLMYLPSVFVCLGVATLLARLPRRAMIVTAAIVIAAFSLRAITYAARWNDPPRLFRVAIAQHPAAVRLYLLLAEELTRRGDAQAAAEELARARAVAPGYYRAWLNSAHTAMEMAEYDRAVEFAREAQRLNPTVEGERLLSGAGHAREAAAATRPATSEEDFFR